MVREIFGGDGLACLAGPGMFGERIYLIRIETSTEPIGLTGPLIHLYTIIVLKTDCK